VYKRQVLTTGFLVLFLFFGYLWFLYASLAFGFTGIFIKPLSRLIAIAWFKLADVLNFVVSKIILGALFFFILWPVAVLYKITNKDKLRLKRTNKSTWTERNHFYAANDLKNIW
jgi:polyferredoxin